MGKGVCGAVLIRSLNGSVVDQVPREKRGCNHAKTKVLPMDLLSEEEVGIIRFGISQIGLRIAGKKKSARSSITLRTHSFLLLLPVERRWELLSSGRLRRVIASPSEGEGKGDERGERKNGMCTRSV